VTAISSKVCIVGDFAVGKTSVVERFVNNHFSDKYLSTVGVKIDTREIELADMNVLHKLVIWDVAGTENFGDKEFAYLRGAAGIIFVADGTRPTTLGSAEKLRRQINDRFGDAPAVMLVNKGDMTHEWDVSDQRTTTLQEQFDSVYRTSAKTGEEVDAAMERLSRLIINKDMRA
jgi:small GTP-binding protein